MSTSCCCCFVVVVVFYFVSYLVSMIKSVTGAFFGSWDCAQDRFTEREVNVIINGRAGISGIS